MMKIRYLSIICGNSGLTALLLYSILFVTGACTSNTENTSAHTPHIAIVPNQNILITEQIQAAIDSCASAGGGTVHFAKGIYITGGIRLKSNVRLYLDKEAVLQGSDNYLEYGSGKWSEGLIMGDSIENISIEGAGTIDGVDCRNPKGEEGFRGPHAIRLTNCKNISIKGITIVRSANWAINCRFCHDAEIEKVTIRGGHDGLHTRFCSNFKVKECDFRTGDDCFAGNDNRDFEISDSKINTSCNGFRIGCMNLIVKNCSIWGPGEYKHLSQNRNNMLAAFVHFSPKDQNPNEFSGNWHITDVSIDNVDVIYNYNFEKGLWQTGKPVTNLLFENILAKNVLKGFSIKGDSLQQLNLKILNSSFTERTAGNKKDHSFEGVPQASPSFFNIENFNQLYIENTDFTTNDQAPIIFGRHGNVVNMKSTKFSGGIEKEPVDFENIGTVLLNDAADNK